MAIKCYHCKGIHTDVATVKACSANTVKPSTTMQDWKAGQAAAIAQYPTLAPAAPAAPAVPAHRTSAAYLALKAKQAPTAVEMVKIPGLEISVPAPAQKMPVTPEILAAAAFKTGQDLELGMYQITGANGEVVIYKIKWNKANTYKYAERLWITTSAKYENGQWIDMPKGKFVYSGGAMKTLTSENKMTDEMAKAFHDATKAKYGVDYGFCCVCGKLLTVKKSIDAGIGPVCVTKF